MADNLTLRLKEELARRGRIVSDSDIEDFLNTEYSSEFDEFLYQEVGYPLLNSLILGLFPGPYSVTSINEYFATGFERFYLNEGHKLKNMCPELIKKIYYLDDLANEYN